MPDDHEIFKLAEGVLEIELNYRTRTAYFHNHSYEIQLDYWQFGALIKELEAIRRKMVTQGPDPWADTDLFTSGLD